MTRTKHIFEPIYKMNYYFVVCKSEDDFIKAGKRGYGINIEKSKSGAARGRTAITDVGSSTIVFVWVKSSRDYSILGHELIHALAFLFERIDTRTTFDNSEPMAYLFQYLFEEFCNKRDWKQFK